MSTGTTNDNLAATFSLSALLLDFTPLFFIRNVGMYN